MSQGNVEIVKASMNAYNRGDIDTALTFFDPEVEWRVPPDLALDIGVVRGREGVREFWAMLADIFGDFRLEIGRFDDAGEKVLANVRLRGYGRRSGAPAAMETHQVVELRDGRITRVDFFLNRADALEAAGLRA